MRSSVPRGACERELERDLECVRSLTVELNVERGAERIAALIVVGAAGPALGGAASAGWSLWKGAAAKLACALLGASAVAGAGVALVVGSGADVGALGTAPPRTLAPSLAVSAAGPIVGSVTRDAPRRALTSAEAPTRTPAASDPMTSVPVSRGSLRVELTGPASATQPAALRSSALAAEVRSLADARAKLAESPAEALESADARRGGALGEEREIIAIRALVALGRKDEARARAATFLAEHPRSSFRAALREIAALP